MLNKSPPPSPPHRSKPRTSSKHKPKQTKQNKSDTASIALQLVKSNATTEHISAAGKHEEEALKVGVVFYFIPLAAQCKTKFKLIKLRCLAVSSFKNQISLWTFPTVVL